MNAHINYDGEPHPHDRENARRQRQIDRGQLSPVWAQPRRSADGNIVWEKLP